jgi:hypothetical protein
MVTAATEGYQVYCVLEETGTLSTDLPPSACFQMGVKSLTMTLFCLLKTQLHKIP